MKSTFKATAITDAKRLVRGEHWLAVRTFLRRRDRVHNRDWKLVLLAGEDPSEELACIRHLMPSSFVIAVDVDARACEAARVAGADMAICADILDGPISLETPVTHFYGRELDTPSVRMSRPSFMPDQLQPLVGADAIWLDITGPASDRFADAIRRYSWFMRRGALLVNVSYGRDVAEIYESGPWRGIPSPLGGRVRHLDVCAILSMNLVSVLAYQGPAMPMCSLMWLPHNSRRDRREGRPAVEDVQDYRIASLNARADPSFERVGDADLEFAVSHPDPELLYALPAERVRSFRRRAAAAKAVATRKGRES